MAGSVASGYSNTVATENNPDHPQHHYQQHRRKVCISRSVFLFGLAIVGAGLSTAAYFILSDSETQQAELRLAAIVDRALTTSREIVQRKRLGVVSMADTVAHIASNASAWPYVTVDGYEAMANNAMDTSKARTLGLCPLVTPDQKQSFEDFAYDFFHYSRQPPFANATGVSSFGKGLWATTTKSPEAPDGRAPVPLDASVDWDSPNRVFTPILQHSSGDKAPVLLLNVNYQVARGLMVDDMIACSQQRAQMDDPSKATCGVLTDMLNLATQQEGSGPDAIMMEPIYPSKQPQTLVGFIVSSIVWRESLENVFSDDVSGIDCILRTANEVFTFHVTDGEASVEGEGDLHDTAFDDYMSEIEIVTRGDFSNTSAIYTLQIYPTGQFFDSYKTINPVIGLVGAMAIILLISVLFYVYDSFVRQEFDANAELLEAKRRFVRFVSHEVRTPLNTVCMGLTLLQDDIRNHSGRRILPPHLTETQRLVAKQQEAANLPKLLEIKQEDATEWLNLSDEVLGNTQAAVNVLNDLLNYDKIQRGKLSLELTLIGIWALVEKTVKEFNLMAAEKNITLKVLFDKKLVSGDGDGDGAVDDKVAATTASALDKRILQQVAVGDVSRISMMLRNLLSNALKFTPEKGSLTVKVRVEEVPKASFEGGKARSSSIGFGSSSSGRSNSMNHRQSKHELSPSPELKQFDLASGETVWLSPSGVVDIRVIDTGVGMTERQLKTVFHDGVQFGANKLQGGGGSGLGMFIARSIVEQHSGTLNCMSPGLGHGTTFIAQLPLFHDTLSAAIGTELENNTAACTPPSSIGTSVPQQSPEFFPQRILVVDDASPNRKLLIRLLENRGHSCDGAEDGKEAVELVKEALSHHPYDTVLLDHEMPVMNGPTACRNMRELGCSSFVAGVTGNLLPEDVAHFKKCGANAVLPKPFKMASLEQLWVEWGVAGKGEQDEEAALANGAGSKIPTVSFNMDSMEP